MNSNDRRTEARYRRGLTRLTGGLSGTHADNHSSDLADLLQLPGLSRAVLFMSIVEGSSHSEIASVLGITESHSRMLATRARRTLRAAAEKAEQ